MKRPYRNASIVALMFLTGCAGFQRSCSNNIATTFGGDWIIVQYDYNGGAIGCWKLQNRSVSNEEKSDGVYWVSNQGHLVHISGWYNRVQVTGGDYATAGRELNVDAAKCGAGHYPAA